MPVLAAFLSSLLGSIVAGLAVFFGKRAAFTLALIAATAAAFGVLVVVLNAILAGIVGVLPSFLTIPLSWILPTNINTLIAARIAAAVAIFGWRWQMNVMLAASHP